MKYARMGVGINSTMLYLLGCLQCLIGWGFRRAWGEKWRDRLYAGEIFSVRGVL